jgi:hypothetical protein
MAEPHPLLVDAQALGRKKPETFQVPPGHRLSLLAELELEPFAKVCLENAEHGERFWVKITGSADGLYEGTVANNLLPGRWDVKMGDVIRFQRRHVYDTRFKGDS